MPLVSARPKRPAVSLNARAAPIKPAVRTGFVEHGPVHPRRAVAVVAAACVVVARAALRLEGAARIV
jgi:hypothetical protein